MDVALTVADYVTMMHDGRKIVEGTPAEIRANEMVHDIYLGAFRGTTSERRCSRSRTWTPIYGQAQASKVSASRWAPRASR